MQDPEVYCVNCGEAYSPFDEHCVECGFNPCDKGADESRHEKAMADYVVFQESI